MYQIHKHVLIVYQELFNIFYFTIPTVAKWWWIMIMISNLEIKAYAVNNTSGFRENISVYTILPCVLKNNKSQWLYFRAVSWTILTLAILIFQIVRCKMLYVSFNTWQVFPCIFVAPVSLRKKWNLISMQYTECPYLLNPPSAPGCPPFFLFLSTMKYLYISGRSCIHISPGSFLSNWSLHIVFWSSSLCKSSHLISCFLQLWCTSASVNDTFFLDIYSQWNLIFLCF